MDTTHLKNTLSSSQSVAIILPSRPTYDAVSAALSLKLSLDHTGKFIRVICPDPMTVEFNRLVGVDSISRSYGSQNLVISFPGQTEAVDKVSYNVEAGELQLVVTPKSGQVIDHQRLKVVPGSTPADLVILFDVEQLSDLGELSQSLSGSQLVALTRSIPGQAFAQSHLYDSSALSLVEPTIQIIESLGLQLTPDAATNLFSALEEATNHFQHPDMTATVFEAAAKLMKKGALKHQPIHAVDFPAGSIPQAIGTSESIQEVRDVNPNPPPSDWLGPKVYRGPMLP